MANLLYSTKFLIISIFLSIPVVLLGQQVLFNKTLDFTPQIEFSVSSVETADKGSLYLVPAWSSVPENVYDSTFLVKLDQYGCLEWHKSYYFYEDMVERKILKGNNGNYFLMSSFTNLSNVEPHWDTSIIEVNELGEVLNEWSYGWEDSNDSVLSLKLLEDGGLIMVGRHTFGMGARGFTIRTDATGAVLWEQKYLDIQSVFSDVVVGPDGYYWITVNASSDDDNGVLLLKLNDLGDIVDEYLLFPNFLEDTDLITVDIKFVDDSSFLVSATGLLYNIIEHTILTKFTIDGDILWSYIADPESLDDDRTEDMLILSDGSILLGGWESTPDLETYERGWLKKLSKDGDLLWDINYVPIDTSGLALYGNRVLELDMLADGTILMTGSANYILADTIPYLNTKMWTMRIDDEGNYIAPLETSLTAEDTSIYVGDSTLLFLDIVSVNGCYDYEWSGTGGMYVVEYDTGIYFEGIETGQYEISCTVTDETGATFTSSIFINVDSLMIGINEMYSQEFSIYPNPASEFISIQTNQPKEGLLNIYDNSGYLVSSMLIPKGYQVNEIEVNDWLNGVYLYEYLSKDSQKLAYGKFIVQH